MKNKILKKILGLFGYKLIEKEVFKNERLVSSKSYLTIDKLLKTLFEEKKINYLIQIGANDGERFDVLNYYIKKYQTKSLLVEPIKENFEKLKKNYKNCSFVSFDNCAISVNNEITHLYKVSSKYIKNYSNHIPGITSFDKEHLCRLIIRTIKMNRNESSQHKNNFLRNLLVLLGQVFISLKIIFIFKYLPLGLHPFVKLTVRNP